MPPDNSTGTTTSTPGTDLIWSSRLNGKESIRLRLPWTSSTSARAARTNCSTPVFRPWSTPNSAKATQTCRKIRMARPGLRQMPDQMSGRNLMRRSVCSTKRNNALYPPPAAPTGSGGTLNRFRMICGNEYVCTLLGKTRDCNTLSQKNCRADDWEKKADIAHESRGDGCINWLDWGVISE